MEIFNHKYIKGNPFYAIKSKDDISNTAPNSIVMFDFEPDMCNFCKSENIKYAIRVKDVKEIIFGNALGASYLLVNKKIAIDVSQKIV